MKCLRCSQVVNTLVGYMAPPTNLIFPQTQGHHSPRFMDRRMRNIQLIGIPSSHIQTIAYFSSSFISYACHTSRRKPITLESPFNFNFQTNLNKGCSVHAKDLTIFTTVGAGPGVGVGLGCGTGLGCGGGGAGPAGVGPAGVGLGSDGVGTLQQAMVMA